MADLPVGGNPHPSGVVRLPITLLKGGDGEWKLKHDDWRIVFTRRITQVKEQDTEKAPEQPAKAEPKVSRELVVLAVTTRGSAYKK